MNHLPKSAALPALLLAALLPLGACSDDSSEAASDPSSEAAEPAPTSDGPSASAAADTPSTPPEPAKVEAPMNGWQVAVRLDASDRFRADYSSPSRIHLLPMNVATDPLAERWGDIFVLSPTRVYDPETQKRRPMPADPVAWLRENPGVDVLREKRVAVGEHRGWQLDVDRDGRELFGDRDGGLEGDGFERMVLWQVEDTWFLAQAGTFREERGLLGAERKDDVMRQVLDSATYTKS